MAKTDVVARMVEPLAAAEGAHVYDVTFNAGKLAVAVTREGGIDLDTLAGISRELGRQLDDQDVIGGSYTLEVTSPGLERPLRTPSHFRGAIGETVTVRTVPEAEGERRARGTVTEADDDTVTIRLEDGDGHRTIRLADIERARTTFEWGPTATPGGHKKKSEPKSGQEARS